MTAEVRKALTDLIIQDSVEKIFQITSALDRLRISDLIRSHLDNMQDAAFAELVDTQYSHFREN